MQAIIRHQSGHHRQFPPQPLATIQAIIGIIPLGTFGIIPLGFIGGNITARQHPWQQQFTPS
jgi:hypothetical protein